jgi:hypothetical protein
MILDLALVKYTILPDSILGLVDSTLSMRLVISPLAFVNISIGVLSTALTLDDSIAELALVETLIGPDHLALAVHLVVLELAIVDLATVGEVVLALAVEFALHELTLVLAAIVLEGPSACLLSSQELAFVFVGSEFPKFDSSAVLDVVAPLAVIETTTLVAKDSLAIGYSLFPVAPVDVSVGVDHHSPPIKLPIQGLTQVLAAIWELNAPESPPHDYFVLRLSSIWGSQYLRDWVFGDSFPRLILLGPLSLILPTLANVDEVVEPVEFLLLWGLHDFLELLVTKERNGGLNRNG